MDVLPEIGSFVHCVAIPLMRMLTRREIFSHLHAQNGETQKSVSKGELHRKQVEVTNAAGTAVSARRASGET